ncbi:GerAB/ArcD/ProY family transporter [Paenibacillus wynnii]|uniref:Uncharacterized protein n=1 Tax=Paenibacillus wynnii TaxID=268407 RepID=A0A098M8S8_9BACL|nr:endospore germination permease [Paenibacillus wynnii]KGE18960.1 hypothetical protein PWYN_06060 [Paenibacillus wynnii]
MNNLRQITTIRAAAVISSTILGVLTLSFPRFMAEAAGSGAPLVMFVGICIALINYWIVAKLCQRFPNETFFFFSSRLVGRPVSTLFSVMLLLFFSFFTAITSRQFGEVTSMVLFESTPIEAIVIIMLVLTMLSTRRNIVKFSYVHFFYLPFTIGSIFAFVYITKGEVDLLNLQPILTTPSLPFWKGTITASTMFQGSFIITLLVPFMKNPKKALRAGSAAIVLIGAIYILILVATVGTFGAEETKLLLLPTLEIARTAAVGQGVFERLDALFLIIWVISVYTTIYSSYYLASYFLQNLFSFLDNRLTSTMLLPYIFGVAMIPDDTFQVFYTSNLINIAGIFLLTGYPLLLWLVSLIRRCKGEAAS